MRAAEGGAASGAGVGDVISGFASSGGAPRGLPAWGPCSGGAGGGGAGRGSLLGDGAGVLCQAERSGQDPPVGRQRPGRLLAPSAMMSCPLHGVIAGEHRQCVDRL
jgi:hypothetical protein